MTDSFIKRFNAYLSKLNINLKEKFSNSTTKKKQSSLFIKHSEAQQSTIAVDDDPANIMHLPNEMHLQILLHLPPPDLKNVANCNHHFNHLVNAVNLSDYTPIHFGFFTHFRPSDFVDDTNLKILKIVQALHFFYAVLPSLKNKDIDPNSISVSLDLAFNIFLKLHNKNYSWTDLFLDVMYHNGWGPEVDKDKAFELGVAIKNKWMKDKPLYGMNMSLKDNIDLAADALLSNSVFKLFTPEGKAIHHLYHKELSVLQYRASSKFSIEPGSP